MNITVDARALLSKLDHLEPEKKDQNLEDLMRQVSMASAVPALTEINHEKEYLVCRQVSEHLTGKIHQPDEFEAD